MPSRCVTPLRAPQRQRPMIEPSIIQPSQSPPICWRIHVIMSSHQFEVPAGAAGLLVIHRPPIQWRRDVPQA